MIAKEKKQAIIKNLEEQREIQDHRKVQVAILTARINELTDHFKGLIRRITTQEEDF